MKFTFAFLSNSLHQSVSLLAKLAWCLALALSLGLTAQAVTVKVVNAAFPLGYQDNQLHGFGLIVGLANDGDKDPEPTRQAVANFYQALGMSVPKAVITSKNIALVAVTATIPPYAKMGNKMTVTVSAMGDAKSINGGTLLETPLVGPDNHTVYAIAQGQVSVGGFSIGAGGGGGGASITKNHPTSGSISGGGIVVKEIPVTLVRGDAIDLVLKQFNFTSASRMAAAINKVYPNSTLVTDLGTVKVKIPDAFQTVPMDFQASLNEIEFQTDTPAIIVINEKTGTIVTSAQIKIGACMIAHGNIVVAITATPVVSQPPPFAGAGAQTAITQTTQIDVKEQKGTGLVALPDLVTPEQIAIALNRLQVPPRDLMAIFLLMREAGALQAELKTQ